MMKTWMLTILFCICGAVTGVQAQVMKTADLEKYAKEKYGEKWLDAAANLAKGLAFDKWADKLRTTFNGDSVIRIRVEKGIFKQGDNNLVDREVFKQKVEVKPLKDYPIDAVFGKVIKAPKDYTDVRGQVTSDYQDMLEKEWVARLREKYPVEVYNSVVATVNKH